MKSVDHYKTSRLAHYHIKNREDIIDDQIPFYEYLNNNFFIIGCRRKNIFEHGLSWVINGHSKKLNVYSAEEKINSFDNIYEQGITAQKQGFIKYLDAYKDYLEWSDKFFNIQSYFDYEDCINNLEDYILNLDFMTKQDNSWNDMFGTEFDTWNKCHKLVPDLLLYENENSISKQLEFSKPGLLIPESRYNELKGIDWPDRDADQTEYDKLDEKIKSEIVSYANQSLPIKFPNEETYNFVNKNIESYVDTSNQLNALVDNGFLVSPIPIKLQTLKEKKEIIKNYNECIIWYNEWVNKTGIGEHFVDNNEMNLVEQSKFSFPDYSERLIGTNQPNGT